MELTREAIKNTSSQIEGIDGYYLLIDKIQNNVNVHPDIAVESCKSLIEGLCKKALILLSEEYRNDKKIRKLCDNEMSALVTNAFNEVFQNNLEAQLYIALYGFIEQNSKYHNIINKSKGKFGDSAFNSISKLNAIRGQRGDISHGRIYPKLYESPVHFSKSIMSITDGICSYMVYEFAETLKSITKEESLSFEDLGEYNDWLDNTISNFPIINERYSKILYIHDKDSYFNIYNDEFLILMKNNVLDEEPESFNTKEEIQKTEMSKRDMQDKLVDYYLSDAQLELVNNFSSTERLNVEKTRKLFGNLLFFNREVLESEVLDILIMKPNLKEVKDIRRELVNKIKNLITDLKKQ